MKVVRPSPVQGATNIVIGTRTWLGREWTHVDIDPKPLSSPAGPVPVDVVADATDIPLPDQCAAVVYSQECLEHFSWRTYKVALREWARLVAPQGRLIVEVPDFLAACQQVLSTSTEEMDRAIQQIIFGGQENEWDYHFVGHTHRTLQSDMEELGLHVESVHRGWEVGYLRAVAVRR